MDRIEKSRRWPATLVLGLALLATFELLLFIDVQERGGIVVGPNSPPLPEPTGALGIAARWAAQNMTPACWVAYLLIFDGLLALAVSRTTGATGSPIRRRPNRFIFIWLTSVPVWCYFDYVNFYFMDAWRYHGLPSSTISRYLGYFVAFAAISPGMFLAGELFQRLGLSRLRTRRGVRVNRPVEWACVALGVVMVAYPFFVADPIGNLTLWVSLMFLVDPLNRWLGAPSILTDWSAGRWGRTISLMLGGALCGLCWEFWNFWAVAKWTYVLPFTGRLEHFRYFEMPWIGFMGFLPFALECWILANFAVALIERRGLRAVEPLPGDDAVM